VIENRDASEQQAPSEKCGSYISWSRPIVAIVLQQFHLKRFKFQKLHFHIDIRSDPSPESFQEALGLCGEVWHSKN